MKAFLLSSNKVLLGTHSSLVYLIWTEKIELMWLMQVECILTKGEFHSGPCTLHKTDESTVHWSICVDSSATTPSTFMLLLLLWLSLWLLRRRGAFPRSSGMIWADHPIHLFSLISRRLHFLSFNLLFSLFLFIIIVFIQH